MAIQFDLSAKQQEVKTQAKSVITEIKSSDTKTIIKELYNKGFGFLPSEEAAYNDYLSLTVAVEEIAKLAPVAASVMVDQILVQQLIAAYGSQTVEFSKDKLYAVLCTEPGTSGVESVNSKAVKLSSGWHIEGKKLIRKDQLDADNYVVFAKDEDDKVRLFLLSKDEVKLSEINKSIAGYNLVLSHAELNLDVTESNTIGVISDNYEKITSVTRTLIAAVSVGIGSSAIGEAVDVAKTTKNSSGAISNSQSAMFTMADMFSELEAGRMLTYLSADSIDNGVSSIKQSTMAKIQATEAAGSISMQSLQMIGNLGYTTNNDFAGLFQSAIDGQIKGGTNRVQKNQVYQYMLSKK